MKKRESAFHRESQLLKLLDQRYSQLGLDKDRPYRKPQVDPNAVRGAALAHADVNRSDPYAYARMRLHLAQGYELVSDVLTDAASQRRARDGRSYQLKEAA